MTDNDTPHDEADIAAFIRDLNELQREHGLAIYSDPYGLTVYDPAAGVPNGGQTGPLGYLIFEDYDTGGFREAVSIHD